MHTYKLNSTSAHTTMLSHASISSNLIHNRSRSISEMRLQMHQNELNKEQMIMQSLANKSIGQFPIGHAYAGVSKTFYATSFMSKSLEP